MSIHNETYMLRQLKEEIEQEDHLAQSESKNKDPCGCLKLNFGTPVFNWQPSEQDLISNYDFNKDKEYFSRMRINSTNMPSY